MKRYVRVKEGTIPLWSKGINHIPFSLFGTRLEIIDETSTTYTVKFNEDMVWEVSKWNTYSYEEVSK